MRLITSVAILAYHNEKQLAHLSQDHHTISIQVTQIFNLFFLQELIFPVIQQNLNVTVPPPLPHKCIYKCVRGQHLVYDRSCMRTHVSRFVHLSYCQPPQLTSFVISLGLAPLRKYFFTFCAFRQVCVGMSCGISRETQKKYKIKLCAASGLCTCPYVSTLGSVDKTCCHCTCFLEYVKVNPKILVINQIYNTSKLFTAVSLQWIHSYSFA